MFGIQDYIEQNIPQGAIFSNIIYSPSTAGVLVKDYTQFGALWIIVHVLILSFPAVVAANATFTDNFGKTLFVMKLDPASNGIFCFPYIIQAGELRITCSSADVDFSVGHQYITVAEANKTTPGK